LGLMQAGAEAGTEQQAYAETKESITEVHSGWVLNWKRPLLVR
jgi:hypothetical protein